MVLLGFFFRLMVATLVVERLSASYFDLGEGEVLTDSDRFGNKICEKEASCVHR